ncbi:hypothetical protein BLNAU_18932 [Blattamonas nauphoetae]|uniref:Uncharacterized protein n=1 Tax=Blattamonas nauphoetae TaxID=2049346 RepID=A0ABQ9X357_9EUKA|nr:hypothetical protein BLNAU_18932 [Blattamonas nauphoetae]
MGAQHDYGSSFPWGDDHEDECTSSPRLSHSSRVITTDTIATSIPRHHQESIYPQVSTQNRTAETLTAEDTFTRESQNRVQQMDAIQSKYSSDSLSSTAGVRTHGVERIEASRFEGSKVERNRVHFLLVPHTTTSLNSESERLWYTEGHREVKSKRGDRTSHARSPLNF